MIVWRITGNEVGPNGNGAAHFATKREADEARREYMSDRGNGCGNVIDLPEKLVIRNRRELAYKLDDAMGYGCS
jgi:hypothetical protein